MWAALSPHALLRHAMQLQNLAECIRIILKIPGFVKYPASALLWFLPSAVHRHAKILFSLIRKTRELICMHRMLFVYIVIGPRGVTNMQMSLIVFSCS